MKRIATSIIICVLLSLIFISSVREAGAAKVYVENVDIKVGCDYDIALWFTDKNGAYQKIGPIFLSRGGSYTFDSGDNPPYMLDGSVCKSNVSTGRHLMPRWFYSITGNSNWKIEVIDIANSIYNQK
jgi:hypothetical protein